MGLSCSCYDGDYEPGDNLWLEAKDYAPLKTNRAKRCCSCKELILVGSLCAEVPRVKVPDVGSVAEKIYGEFDGENGIPLASKFLCEPCADIFFSLAELGYCEQPFEDQRELLEEYVYEHGEGATK